MFNIIKEAKDRVVNMREAQILSIKTRECKKEKYSLWRSEVLEWIKMADQIQPKILLVNLKMDIKKLARMQH